MESYDISYNLTVEISCDSCTNKGNMQVLYEHINNNNNNNNNNLFGKFTPKRQVMALGNALILY